MSVICCVGRKGQFDVYSDLSERGKQYKQKNICLFLFSIIFEHFHLCLILLYSRLV